MKTLICKFIGHHYTEINKSSILAPNYQCKTCKQKFTTDGYGTITKLTPFWEENNLMFKKYIQDKGAINI